MNLSGKFQFWILFILKDFYRGTLSPSHGYTWNIVHWVKLLCDGSFHIAELTFTMKRLIIEGCIYNSNHFCYKPGESIHTTTWSFRKAYQILFSTRRIFLKNNFSLNFKENLFHVLSLTDLI